ncbi:MAG: DUF736 domain-containing protein [Alphaproteobacteria bacterium]|nr:DUF736 domain-containing protein [Alphaproteobacteria bacterium]
MIIGNFTYNQARDIYTGELSTLTVTARPLVFQPNEAKGDKAKRQPHYRIVSPAQGGDVEIGAAWKKHSDEGREYLSVTLADPALPQPINCAMVASSESIEAFILVWSRETRKAKTA